MQVLFVRRSLAAISAAVVLCSLLIVGVFGAVPASAGTDDYPSQWRNAPMDTVVDSWGEWNRECTSFVAWRLHARNGFEMPFHDNATGWGADASSRGYPVNMNPAVGAVAWWSAGHVAWVEAVSGPNVTVEEYNFNYPGTYSERTVAANSVSGYIHFSDLAAYHYQPFSGDFNGDGLADIGLRDASTGIFFIKHGPGFNDQISYAWAAGTNYQPFVGDFNGDGLADIGLRDADIGVFYIKHGTNFGDQITYPWAAG